MDNNVFVLRCRHTGDAVLLDAANEHERLLELASTLGVRRVLETHGHWDHIQAVPELRDAGYSVGVTAEDAAMLDSYDEIIEHDTVIEVGRLRLRTIHTPGPHARFDVLPGRGQAAAVQRRHALPRRPRQHAASRAATSTPSSRRSTGCCSPRSTPDTIVMPGHGDDTTIGAESPHLQEWIDRGW